MPKQVSFSGENLGVLEIGNYHRDLEASLKFYFSGPPTASDDRFAGYTVAARRSELDRRLALADWSSSLLLLASVEAAFRVDYLQRSQRRGKDPVSRAFRKLHRSKGGRVSFEDEILQAWLVNEPASRAIVGELRSVFKFRHWLAHGSFWEPKIGRKYDFGTVFVIADVAMKNFRLDSPEN